MPGLVNRRGGRSPVLRDIDAEVEPLTCRLRRQHPRWGAPPDRLRVGQREDGTAPRPRHRAPGDPRNALVKPHEQQRKRNCRRWQRLAPMQLWQLGIISGVPLADGRAAKLVTGVDDIPVHRDLSGGHGALWTGGLRGVRGGDAPQRGAVGGTSPMTTAFPVRPMNRNATCRKATLASNS